MSETKKRYGYTGKGLRVNLTTGKFTVEPTFPRFNGLIGGTAFGYRVLWDEVPPDTDCYSPENKVVIAPGPLSGTGAICSGRTALTTLWPTSWPQSLIASAHVGGEIAHKMKYAGWDFIIIEGEAKKPCYLYIHNDHVELRDAHFVWNQGTKRSYAMIAQETNADASIGVIGPAGENLVPMSNMMFDKSHSAGGVGSIFGKKNLKAIVVRGDQAIHIHAKPQEWEALMDSHRAILGAHTQTVGSARPRLGRSQPAGGHQRRHSRRQSHRLPHLLGRVLSRAIALEVPRPHDGLLRLPDSLLLGHSRRRNGRQI